MELSEDIFNQIHQYLNNTLAEDEHKKFKNQMNTNPALAEEVATQRRIKAGLKINNYKQQFKNIHTQLKNENALPIFEEKPLFKKEASTFKWHYFAYAASITLIIGVGFFFYQKQASTESEEQVATTKDNTTKQAVKTDKGNNIELAEIEKPFKKNTPINYNKIYTDNFTDSPVIDSPFSSEKYGISPSKIASWEADTLSLRGAINYLKTGKNQDAQAELQKLRNSKFDNIRFHSDWYLALVYLHQKDGIRATEILKKIRDDKQHLYAKKAEQILKVLDNN